MLGPPIIPERDEIDKWLFLARHVGLPTRLLDWREGALIGLYFALHEAGAGATPIVWMLNPLELNLLTVSDAVPNAPTITWGGSQHNVGSLNIKAAWSLGEGATDLPVAVTPPNIYPRMTAQQSCFTVHGRDRRSLTELVGPGCLKAFSIKIEPRRGLQELRLFGISHITVFPEPEGLARDLERWF